jgi:hypothetical protein
MKVLDGAAYHTHLDNVERLRKGTLQARPRNQFLTLIRRQMQGSVPLLLLST